MISLMLSLLLHGNPYLARGIEQVRALDEQAAVTSLLQAKNWKDNTTRDLAQIHMWFGLAYAGLARESDARQSFRAALLLDDTLELPPGTSPVVTQWWMELGGNREKTDLAPAVQPVAPPMLIDKPQSQSRLRGWSFWTGVGLSIAGAAALIAGSYYGAEAVKLRNAAENTERAWAAEAINREAVIVSQRANWLWGGGGLGVLLGATLLILNLAGVISAETLTAAN